MRSNTHQNPSDPPKPRQGGERPFWNFFEFPPQNIDPASMHDPGPLPRRILLPLAWVLLAGQGAALLLVFFRSGLHPVLGYALALMLISALINLAGQHRWGRRNGGRAWMSDREAGALLALYMLQLTLFFMLTGGILNPFIILMFGPVILSATSLSRRMTGGLILLAIIFFAFLTLVYIDLPWRNRTGAVEALILPLDYRAATWTAMVISLVFLTLFLSWQSNQARRTAQTLEATRQALDRDQTLAKIGGLAAAAAHELGTPLATISVAARELADVLSEERASPDLIDDALLLVEETQRCRQIIMKLSIQDRAAAQDDHESYLRLDMGQILDRLVQNHGRSSIGYSFQSLGMAGVREPHLPHQPQLTQGLGNVLQNAFQFANSQVTATWDWTSDIAKLTICDDGPGFARTILDRLGEPYVRGGDMDSQRPSMGLGLFIATSLLRQSGAKVAFKNRDDGVESGAEVSLTWDLPI